MSDKIKALREQHRKAVSDARSIMEAETLEGDAEARFDAAMAEADKLEAQIGKLEKLNQAESRAAKLISDASQVLNQSEGELEDNAENYRKAFDNYVRNGAEGVPEEFRGVLARGRMSVDTRAQSVSGGSPAGIYGGYTVPEGFLNELERAMKSFGGMLDVSRTIVTAGGGDLPMPYSDDTGNVGAILGENQPVTEQDVTFGQTTLGAYKYTSKLIRVSWELLQDSAFNMDSFIGEVAGERLGRILNTHFTTGDGSAKPSGVVTGATLGVSATGTTGISYDNLIDLEHSVGRAYRQNGRYMFNDSTLKVLRKLKDSQGRPLWQPSLQEGVAASFNGRPYTINDDVAAIGIGAKSVLFGDFQHYIVRKVKDYTMVRLQERYAELGQVGFFIYCRFDGKLKNAGQNPIKYLQHAAASP